MNARTTVAVMASILLVISASLNVYQARQITKAQKLTSWRGPYCFGDDRMRLPISGVSPRDIAEILGDMPPFLAEYPGETGILSIEAWDSDHVVIKTGHIEGPLSGSGRHLGFVRTPRGWEFDQRSRNAVWMSQRKEAPTTGRTLLGCRNGSPEPGA